MKFLHSKRNYQFTNKAASAVCSLCITTSSPIGRKRKWEKEKIGGEEGDNAKRTQGKVERPQHKPKGCMASIPEIYPLSPVPR